ncbi:MAG: hypothetical protein JWR75_1068 [Devosia sp.]|nr:hypothetical protein [Devosia sp.]
MSNSVNSGFVKPPAWPPFAAIPLYALAALAAAFEMWALWGALHPNVSADYRAYYIDHTITCLNQAVSGSYQLGALIDFTSPGREAAMPLRVCGWEGPAGDGTHAVGESSRLRFTFDAPVQPLRFVAEMVAVDRAGASGQRVEIVINGESIETVTVPTGRVEKFTVDLPPALIAAADGRFDVELFYPQAILMSPSDNNTRKRSIKLVSAGILPTT